MTTFYLYGFSSAVDTRRRASLHFVPVNYAGRARHIDYSHLHALFVALEAVFVASAFFSSDGLTWADGTRKTTETTRRHRING